jgi:ATP-binding cassette subfamily B protein
MGFSNDTLKIYCRALVQVKQFWPDLFVILMLGFSWTPIALLIPVPVKIVVDNVLGSDSLPYWLNWLSNYGDDTREVALWFAVFLSVAIAIVILMHNTLDWMLRERLSEKIVCDFRQKMLSKSFEVSALTSQGDDHQSSAYKIIHDAPALQWVTIYGIGPILTALFSLVGILAITARITPTIAMIAMATSLPLVYLIHRSQRRMCTKWHKVKEIDCSTSHVAQEALSAWRVVVNFGQELRELARFQDFAHRAYTARMGVMGLQASLGSLMSLGTALGTAAILFFTVRDVQNGVLSAGDLLLITAYVGQLYGPIHTIGSHISNQQSALASMERSFALMDLAPATSEKPDAIPLDEAQGDFEMRNVSFRYKDGKSVLSNCFFKIPAGSWVGVVGPTGAGKTTLVNLLVRFIDPTRGGILLDGRDLRDYRLADLRRQFAVLGQEALLISGTIEENIACARPSASREDVVRAANLAQAHQFIESLPQGYDTAVGEGGLKLSGGERQRVALARAYLKDAPILILDEPTSALDMKTENLVIEGLKRIMAGRTVFLITHRPSALQTVDMVLHVESGSIDVAPCYQGERAS